MTPASPFTLPDLTAHWHLAQRWLCCERCFARRLRKLLTRVPAPTDAEFWHWHRHGRFVRCMDCQSPISAYVLKLLYGRSAAPPASPR